MKRRKEREVPVTVLGWRHCSRICTFQIIKNYQLEQKILVFAYRILLAHKIVQKKQLQVSTLKTQFSHSGSVNCMLLYICFLVCKNNNVCFKESMKSLSFQTLQYWVQSWHSINACQNQSIDSQKDARQSLKKDSRSLGDGLPCQQEDLSSTHRTHGFSGLQKRRQVAP